ncbi:hypothetical protein BKG76_03725 [Mycobacteroides franklinii]|uniref:WXG100 family type VII secretion target n=1 Tax=Mycobacteroides franklinii TaxID=948102 RepID=A0A1S1LEM0_9MYCO|nr:WXG100 family type VII secretion target [Mycobacteroides franklinii]OHU30838.1 hypothetical protein BKG76_03725 [Mycobacteroides franklinii]
MSTVSGSSGGQLHLDPDELRTHADRLRGQASDLKEAHEAAHRAMADAQAGFGSGRAAQALSRRISDWQKETADHHAELTSHGEYHTSSAAKFVDLDATNRGRIEEAGSGRAV